MIKKISQFLLFLFVVYVALCIVLFVLQRSFIYYPPNVTYINDPTTLKLKNDGEELLVSVRQQKTTKAVIYFGGNGEDVSYNLPSLSNIFPDAAIYLSHYRSFGGSTGKPSEQSLVNDAQILFDYVHAQHADIVVIGRSLGSGVAIQLASSRSVSKLVLVTPYNSILELAQNQFPYFPVGFLLQDKFESWRYAQKITAPTLIIATPSDELIPFSSTQSLLKHFSQNVVTMTAIKNVGHNTINASPAYKAALRKLNF
ncbi:MAG: lysophospholipase [Undibacterium sp.]|nr:lysophospholipase [Undibacterium sp.]